MKYFNIDDTFLLILLLTDEKSVEKACKAMVPSPIYEEPQYEIVQPELNTLETSHQTADAVASIDNPFYRAVPTNEGTAVAEASEPSQGSLEGSMPLTGTDLSNNNYIVMHSIGTLGTLVWLKILVCSFVFSFINFISVLEN